MIIHADCGGSLRLHFIKIVNPGTSCWISNQTRTSCEDKNARDIAAIAVQGERRGAPLFFHYSYLDDRCAAKYTFNFVHRAGNQNCIPGNSILHFPSNLFSTPENLSCSIAIFHSRQKYFQEWRQIYFQDRRERYFLSFSPLWDFSLVRTVTDSLRVQQIGRNKDLTWNRSKTFYVKPHIDLHWFSDNYPEDEEQ